MQTYGHFDDTAREYVITRPDTPFPWINYLGNSDFFSLVSNTAGGYAFYKDAKFRRITRYRYNGIPMDNGGRYFYIKHGPTVWSPTWKPCRTPLDHYECRHGMGYTRIVGERGGIRAALLLFVPLGTPAEIQRLTLTNLTARQQNIKLFSFQEWCLWNAATDMENFQRNWSTGEVEIDGSTIYHKTEYKERRDHYAFYSLTNARVDGFDTDRETFVGLYNELSLPQRVREGSAAGSVAHGWSPIASHYLNITLQPGEERELIFLLGYAEMEREEKFSADELRRKLSGELISSQASDVTLINKRKARGLIHRFATTEAVDTAFRELGDMWDRTLSKFHVESPEPRLDRMVNIWNQYQCQVTFCFSRSASFFESGVGRGMGFRDSNQDLVGFVHQAPQRARQRILDIAATQFPDGGCYHQYQPLTKRGNNDIGGGFNDDPLWLLFGTTAYIRETGDTSILAEPVAWDNQPGSEAPLMEHLSVSFRHVTRNLGPHGLPLIGRADWNDCLNLNCFSWDPDESFQTTENRSDGSRAESLMIAGLFVVCGRDYAELCRHVGDEREAQAVDNAIAAMEEAVRLHGWDGDWYLRAYDFSGRKIGSRECDEGKIFIESQGFCAMARIGAPERMPERALDACKRHLDTPHGMVLNTPAYTRYLPELGELSSYPAGYKENAGIFCHNNPWVIIAECLAGRGDDAWEHYTKICPAWIQDHALHRVEPYVYCQMVAGRDAAKPGEGKNSWLTGTAAWNWLLATQYILGIQPTYQGLRLAPCLPHTMEGFRVSRELRGATFDIRVHNPDHRQAGLRRLTLDGADVEGDTIPVTPGPHTVEAWM